MASFKNELMFGYKTGFLKEHVGHGQELLFPGVLQVGRSGTSRAFCLAVGSKTKPHGHFPAFDFPDATLPYRISRWEKLLGASVHLFFSKAKCFGKFSPV